MGEYVAKLYHAGAPIVAGTDGFGPEIVRELELYVKGGLTPAEALATGTITGNVTVAGTIAPGNSIGALNVTGTYTQNGDPERNIGDLRHVDQVMSDGYLMSGDSLRKEAGYSAMPK